MQTSPQVFANTPASESLRKNALRSQWANIRMHPSTGGLVFEAYMGLRKSAETGAAAFEGVGGCEFLQRSPEKLAILRNACVR